MRSVHTRDQQAGCGGHRENQHSPPGHPPRLGVEACGVCPGNPCPLIWKLFLMLSQLLTSLSPVVSVPVQAG